jgi:putative tricarboxylic transport membrane protein
MKRACVITNTLWFALACLVAYESRRLGVGTLVSPGPGFIPFGAAVLLGVLALVAFLQIIFGSDCSLSGFKRGDILKILLVNIVLAAGVLLWERIGFIPVTLLLLIFMFRLLKPIGWGRVVLAAVLTMTFIWVLFVRFLGLRLPQGTIWRYFIN